jgi:uncharacterized SAM-binding protein YcdF (DUF218 family)
MAFVLSKIFWFLFNPGNLLVLGLLAGFLAGFAPWGRLRRLGRIVLGTTLGAILAVAILPLGSWVTAPLEERFPAPAVLPQEVRGIIALGGAFHLRRSADRGTAQLNQHAERMIAFANLARRYPEARLIFTGGSGSLRDREIRESDFAPGLMAELGIDPGRILFERESRNTYENAVYSKRLAKAAPGEVWLLVTSAFHMPRAMGVFRAAGWKVVPYPVDYQTSVPGWGELGFDLTGGLQLLGLGLHEWAGLAAYRVLGWTVELYPAPKPRP